MLQKVRSVEFELTCVADNPVISAGLGTFKRKQQVRHFLETMPRENVDDVFSCPYMQSKRFEVGFFLRLYFSVSFW